MAGHGGRKKRMATNKVEGARVRELDKLARFEQFQEEVLPKLQRMLAEGKTPQEILEWGKAYAAARMVTEAIVNPDANKALTASKDILDRTEGKAKERIEHEHKYAKMKDEELDALLASRLTEVEEDSDTKQKH